MNKGSPPRILATARLDLTAVARLREVATVDLEGESTGSRPLTANELSERAPRYDLLIVETDPVTADVLQANPKLVSVVCCRGTPVNVDVACASSLGIPVLYTPGRNADATADFAVGLMIDQLRHIGRTYHLLVSGELPGHRAAAATKGSSDTIWRLADGSLASRLWAGPELRDLVLGLVGCGRIGEAVAHRALAFGMTVIAYDPYRSTAPSGVLLGTLDELLANSDVVSIHCKLTPETEGLIGRAQLQRMKPGAILINTARARLVDDGALLEALTTGTLGGAALDVFATEPLPEDSPYLKLSNVTLTPHLGGASTSVVRRQSEMVVEDILRLLQGELPLRQFGRPLQDSASPTNVTSR